MPHAAFGTDTLDDGFFQSISLIIIFANGNFLPFHDRLLVSCKILKPLQKLYLGWRTWWVRSVLTSTAPGRNFPWAMSVDDADCRIDTLNIRAGSAYKPGPDNMDVYPPTFR